MQCRSVTFHHCALVAAVFRTGDFNRRHFMKFASAADFATTFPLFGMGAEGDFKAMALSYIDPRSRVDAELHEGSRHAGRIQPIRYCWRPDSGSRRLAAFDDNALFGTAGADDRHLRRNDDQAGDVAGNHAEIRQRDRGAAQFLRRDRTGRGVGAHAVEPASKLLARSPTLRKAGTSTRSTAMLHPCADDAYR